MAIRSPTVADDGMTVTLDLHGATVAEAEVILRRCIPMAATRGRRTLRLIHGTSTSEQDRYRPTIKALASRILDEGSLSEYVNEHFGFEGHTTVSLVPAVESVSDRISIADLAEKRS